jgi:hypothetical protein
MRQARKYSSNHLLRTTDFYTFTSSALSLKTATINLHYCSYLITSTSDNPNYWTSVIRIPVTLRFDRSNLYISHGLISCSARTSTVTSRSDNTFVMHHLAHFSTKFSPRRIFQLASSHLRGDYAVFPG